MTVEDQIAIVISEDEIKSTLLGSKNIPELKENREEAEIIIDSLVEFLLH